MVGTNRHSRRRRAADGGFSLIELLLVLVILASLAAIVTPKFTKRSEQARITATKSELDNIQAALDAFEVDCGRYPTESEGLAVLYEQPDDADDWMGPYLEKKTPLDAWGGAYVYRQPGDHNTAGYDLYSFGPNKTEGDDDDICNWDEDD